MTDDDERGWTDWPDRLLDGMHARLVTRVLLPLAALAGVGAFLYGCDRSWAWLAVLGAAVAIGVLITALVIHGDR